MNRLMWLEKGIRCDGWYVEEGEEEHIIQPWMRVTQQA